MKVIVAGLGQTGWILADLLAKEKHDVIVIDSNQSRIDEATNKLSVSGVCGSCVSRDILIKAGAETADVIVAVTAVDEVNLMVCKIASNCGTRFCAARIYQPELSEDKDELAQEFAVDYLINPKVVTAGTILKQIDLPGKAKADAFFDNYACVIRVKVDAGMLPKSEMSMIEIRKLLGQDILVGTVTREDKIFIPKGDFVINEGDVLGLVGSREAINAVIDKLGLAQKPVKNVFIIGAGEIAYYLTGELLKSGKKVTILDSDAEQCKKILKDYPEAKVCIGNGLKEEELLQEGLGKADVCLSLTGSDENNLVMSLFAWSMGIDTIITKVNSIEYERLLNRVSIDTTVSPAILAAADFCGYVRNIAVYNDKGNDINSVHLLAGGCAEAIEFIAYEHNKCINKTMKELGKRFKKGILIGLIIRDDKCIIPNGETAFKTGDRVVVFVDSKAKLVLNTIDDLMK